MNTQNLPANNPGEIPPVSPIPSPPSHTFKNFLKGSLLVILTPFIFKIIIYSGFLVRFWIDSQGISLPFFLYDLTGAIITSVIVYLLAKLIKFDKAKNFSLIVFAVLMVYLAFLVFKYKEPPIPPQNENSKTLSPTEIPSVPSIPADETGNWGTYIIESAGIDFKFPPNFKKESEKEDILKFTSDKYLLEIFWDSNLSDFKQQPNGKACTAYPYCMDIDRGYTKSTVDNKEVYSAQITSDQGTVDAYAFIIGSEQKAVFLRLSHIVVPDSQNKIAELTSLRDQIVNSFKFSN